MRRADKEPSPTLIDVPTDMFDINKRANEASIEPVDRLQKRLCNPRQTGVDNATILDNFFEMKARVIEQEDGA